MDSELVSSSLSATEGSEHNSSLPHFTYTERFYEMFPYYLSIGMTPEQYWDGDCTLVKYYRQAEEMRNDKRNQEMWLQGMYIYEAICDVSPVLHAFAKKGAKPHPYPSKPYAISEKQIKQERLEKERKLAEKGKRFMEMMMLSNNKRFTESSQTQ